MFVRPWAFTNSPASNSPFWFSTSSKTRALMRPVASWSVRERNSPFLPGRSSFATQR